jgi:DNA-binding NarL/FixJ family response regulator
VTIDFSTEATLGAPLIVARPAKRRLAGLTPRQDEIASLVAEGLSNKDIAQRTCLSVGTVKDHVHAILNRLGLRRRGEIGARLHGR